MIENGEQTLWGIHAGRTGDAETLFLKKNFVALGWPQVGAYFFEHYEKFDARRKGLLPLRRVYVPEPVEVGEE